MDLTRIYSHMPTQIRPILHRGYQCLQLLTTDSGYFYTSFTDNVSPESVREAFISSFLGDEQDFDRYLTDFKESPAGDAFREYGSGFDSIGVVNKEYKSRTQGHSQAYWQGVKLLEGITLYSLVRAQKPDTFVETGVANGWSSVCILSAMSDVGTGELYSIDYINRSQKSKDTLEDEDYNFIGNAKIPRDEEPGWLIPEELRNHWELHTGRSQRITPQLLSELGRIDIFQHDSEHSNSCMMMEYELGWEHLRDGGILLSDDTRSSLAWDLFLDERDPVEFGLIAFPNQGFAKKSM